MATDRLRIIVDDVLEQIKQTFDDRDVSKAQVAYWCILVGNKLLGGHIKNRKSGAYLSVFSQVPVYNVSASGNPNFVQGRKFIQLPSAIFDFDKDDGVEYLTYTSSGLLTEAPKFTTVKFHRTYPTQAEWLTMNPHTNPTPMVPYWYRVGNLIYLLGTEKIPISNVEIGIYMNINPVETIDIDQPFPFPQELLQTLKMQVLDIARASFFFYPDTGGNEGDDDTVKEMQGRVGKIQSVNSQQSNTEPSANTE